MKLIPDAHANSFYETFSDLIFCTLILFVLLVMSLVMQVRTRVDNAIMPGEFTGATGRTRLFIAFVPSEAGTTQIAWIPTEIAVDALLVRGPGRDPLASLCDMFVSEESLTLTPAETFVDLGPGFTTTLSEGFISLAEMGAAISLLREAAKLWPGEANNAAALRRRLCGDNLVLNAETVSPELTDAYTDWRSWAAELGDRPEQVHSRLIETVSPLRERAVENMDPEIHFRVDGQKVVVGDMEFDTNGFLGMLRAVSPGRGFKLVYRPGPDEPKSLPAWVLDGPMATAGINARVVVKSTP